MDEGEHLAIITINTIASEGVLKILVTLATVHQSRNCSPIPWTTGRRSIDIDGSVKIFRVLHISDGSLRTRGRRKRIVN